MCFCFVFLRLVYPMLPVSLDCSCLITPSVFSNVYLNTSFWKKVVHSKIDYLRLCLLPFFLGGGYAHIFSTNKTDPHDITMIWMTALFSIKINNPNQHIANFVILIKRSNSTFTQYHNNIEYFSLNILNKGSLLTIEGIRTRHHQYFSGWYIRVLQQMFEA